MKRLRLDSSVIDTSTPVVILGLSRGIYHHGALGIARSAGRLGIPVHRVAGERFAPARASRYSRGWVTIPSEASTADCVALLHRLADRIGRAVLIGVDDPASVFIDEHAHALRSSFVFPERPDGLARELASKRGMYELCKRHDIPTPRSGFPASEEELLAYVADSGFPIVLKSINVADAPPTAPRVVIAANRDQLVRAHDLMGGHAGNVMLQEYVPGGPETVWMFNGYFDADSECRFGFTGKKIRQSPPYTGITTLGACLPNAAVHNSTVRLMKAVGYTGILDIGYRYDARDGTYKLLDVNPRIGGTFRLFVGAEGLDVLRALYLDLTGQAIPSSTFQAGRRWLVDLLDLRSSATYIRRGDVTLLQWLRSFTGIRELAWLATDDPLPFAALALWLLGDWLPRNLRSA